MTRPTRTMALVTAVAALIACGGGFFIGRSSGAQKAPGLAVQRVEQIDRPVVGPEIPVPTPIEIPARLPK
jgi:hypothetical protein